MQKFLPQLTTLLFLTVITVGLSGCAQRDAEKSVAQKTKTPETVTSAIPAQKNSVQVAENTEILYNADGSIDTSNWKTYTNEEYGFSVKYPQGWKVKESKELGDVVINLTYKSDNYIIFYPTGGGVSASSRPYMQEEYEIDVAGIRTHVREWLPKSGHSDFGQDYSYTKTVAMLYFDKDSVSEAWRNWNNNSSRVKLLYDENSKEMIYAILNTIRFLGPDK